MFLNYGSKKNVGNRVNRFGGRRAHEKINYPGDFDENKLNGAQIIQNIHDCAEEYNHWHDLFIKEKPILYEDLLFI